MLKTPGAYPLFSEGSADDSIFRGTCFSFRRRAENRSPVCRTSGTGSVRPSRRWHRVYPAERPGTVPPGARGIGGGPRCEGPPKSGCRAGRCGRGSPSRAVVSRLVYQMWNRMWNQTVHRSGCRMVYRWMIPSSDRIAHQPSHRIWSRGADRLRNRDANRLWNRDANRLWKWGAKRGANRLWNRDANRTATASGGPNQAYQTGIFPSGRSGR